jgi:two-component system, OmpR family, sensor histidine kinase SenX3
VDAFTVFLVVLATGSLIALFVVSTRFLRLRGQVQTVLGRVRSSGAGSPSRGLYRTVRELERELDVTRQEASLLRVAVDRTEIGIVIADRDRSILFTNPAADAVMKGRLGEAVARTRVLQLIERITFTGQAESIELDLYTPVRRILNLSGLPLTDGTAPGRAAVVYIIDFTERYRVEAMRRDFVANASHELKTPLGALSLLAETLVEAQDEETRVRLAQRLQAEASRMAKVIDDVLVLAETESLGAEQVPTSITAILSEAVASVAEIAAERDIDLVAGEVVEAVVAADRAQLLSAIQNLLNNAITYTAVKDEPGTVRYGCRRENGSVRIDIEDSGIGIPERYTDRVFERFFRVDRARSRESGGTGLGLSIVRNVAVAHGGRVAVSSQVGVGSTFTMWLPVVQEEAA